MLSQKNVLVLGSKAESKLPDVSVDMIYSANGAAERALHYKKYYPRTNHTAIVAANQFMKDDMVKSRVIKSKPNKLIVRSGAIEVPKELIDCETIYLSKREQFNFQSKFYKSGALDIILGELKYEENYFEALRHLYRCISYRGFLGASTGFFCILFAAMENPNSNILSSGISLVEGGHYYTSKDNYGFITKNNLDNINKKKNVLKDKFRNTSRSRVERYLINRVKNVYKNMIVSLDNSFVDNSGVKMWKGKVF